MNNKMKQFFYTVALVLLTSVTFGQSDKHVAIDLKATSSGSGLVLTWTDAKSTQAGSWQVEASVNGKDFTAIGQVWGADPKSTETTYSFKQKNEKTGPSYRYYRVQFINTQNELIASRIIGQSK